MHGCKGKVSQVGFREGSGFCNSSSVQWQRRGTALGLWGRWPGSARGCAQQIPNRKGCELSSAGLFVPGLFSPLVINTAPGMSVGAQEMVSKRDQRRPQWLKRVMRGPGPRFLAEWVITEGPGYRPYPDPDASARGIQHLSSVYKCNVLHFVSLSVLCAEHILRTYKTKHT